MKHVTAGRVLQLPSPAGAVTPSSDSSLRTLADVLTLRAPADLQAAAAQPGLHRAHRPLRQRRAV